MPPTTTPPRRILLSKRIAEQIKQHIIDNGLKPGDRLPTEHDFAQRFGASRISVREATKALEFIGVLDAAPRRGLHVAEVDMSRVSEFLSFHLAISDYPPEQLIQTRVVIECGGLSRVASRMVDDPEIYDSLKDINERLRAAANLQEWIELDIAFHRKLLEASDLGPLVAFNDLLDLFFQRFRESVKRGEWGEGADSHQRMIDALRDGRMDDATREVRQHVESHLARLDALRNRESSGDASQD